LLRINVLEMQQQKQDINKNLGFLKILLQKLDKIGNKEDRQLIRKAARLLGSGQREKVLNLFYEYRQKMFFRGVPPQVLGYEFYLWLKFVPERLDSGALARFEERIAAMLEKNPHYPDMWNYLALIHLMQCRDYFLQGLDNFQEATRLNPDYRNAQKNLRLAENDGREFLSLIKAIVK
ncbi:MAG: hypothetical protein WAN36_10945, partial [Calditrichia bacterium]